MVLFRLKKIALLLCTFTALAMPLQMQAWSFTKWLSDCYKENRIVTAACLVASGVGIGYLAYKTYYWFKSSQPHENLEKCKQTGLRNEIAQPSSISPRGFKYEGISIPDINAVDRIEKEFDAIKSRVDAESSNNHRFVDATGTQTQTRLDQLDGSIKQLNTIYPTICGLNYKVVLRDITNPEYKSKIQELKKSVVHLLYELKDESDKVFKILVAARRAQHAKAVSPLVLQPPASPAIPRTTIIPISPRVRVESPQTPPAQEQLVAIADDAQQPAASVVIEEVLAEQTQVQSKYDSESEKIVEPEIIEQLHDRIIILNGKIAVALLSDVPSQGTLLLSEAATLLKNAEDITRSLSNADLKYSAENSNTSHKAFLAEIRKLKNNYTELLVAINNSAQQNRAALITKHFKQNRG